MAGSGRLQRTTPGVRLVQTSMQLRPDTLEVIDALAMKEGLSRSAIIARLIDRGLQTEKVGVAA